MFQNLQSRWVRSGAPFFFVFIFSWINTTPVHLKKKGKMTPWFHNSFRYLFIEIIIEMVNALIYYKTKYFSLCGESGFQT